MAPTSLERSSSESQDDSIDEAIKEFFRNSSHRALLSSGPVDVASWATDCTPGPYAGSSASRSVEQSGPPTPVQGEPQNFALVHTGLYRSSFPLACNFGHLSALKLRTIV